MFSEPLLAHPAEIGGVHPAWHPHPRNEADRDQHDPDADDEEHMVVAASRRRMAILTRGPLTVCALVHTAIGPAYWPFGCRPSRRQPWLTCAFGNSGV